MSLYMKNITNGLGSRMEQDNFMRFCAQGNFNASVVRHNMEQVGYVIDDTFFLSFDALVEVEQARCVGLRL